MNAGYRLHSSESVRTEPLQQSRYFVSCAVGQNVHMLPGAQDAAAERKDSHTLLSADELTRLTQEVETQNVVDMHAHVSALFISMSA